MPPCWAKALVLFARAVLVPIKRYPSLSKGPFVQSWKRSAMGAELVGRKVAKKFPGKLQSADQAR